MKFFGACLFISGLCNHSGAADDSYGPTRYIWELAIEGNQNISTEDILDAIASSRSSHFPILGSKTEFNAITLYSDQKRIEHLYKRSGYYQARVLRTDMAPCKEEEPTKLCLKIHVSEGAATQIERVNIVIHKTDETLVSEADVSSRIGVHKDAIFNYDTYSSGKAALILYLQELSYPLPKVESVATYDQNTNLMAISYEVTPGVKASFGNITFQGLRNIRSDDLYPRLVYKTGMVFNPHLLEESKDLLESLDIFRSVEAKLVLRKNNPKIVDVIYEVQEKPLKSLQLGFGFSLENSRQEGRIRGEWNHKNFHNYLRKFSVSGEPRYAVLPSIFRPQQSGPLGTTEVSVLHPAFLSPKQDLRTSVGFDADLEQGYRWYGPRVNAQLSRTLSRKFTLTGGYSFRYLQFYNITVGSSSAGAPQELLYNNSYRLGYIDQQLTWDQRNVKLSPSKGGYAVFYIAESAPPLASSFLYIRIRPEYRHFFPIGRRSVLATRAAYGRIFNLRQGASPITERFYGGGANDHRGFTYHRLSPQISSIDARSVPIGGDTQVLFSVEQRFQLARLYDNWLVLGLFFDVGDVVESSDKLNFKSLHYAVGPGLRYETPVGVVRADVGFRLNRLDGATNGRPNPDPGQRFAIHVSFGEAF